ncbi:hypothetical protein G3I13_01825 [Streptomyces sp. SID6673]|nr:hypothetical protein [Streptomyces sp. SID11726]NDZ94899.1 hypothetical protein [Streptomyces sp. SID11726]NEB23059.1 hypothetical protein [Streptomyces sp. SID6673]NED67067.1 hypothetical protein [Streptomyces sp. SID10244]
MLSSDPTTRCIACLNIEAHRDGNGVCERCQYIHRETYEELTALLGVNDVHIETNAVLSTGEIE